MARTLLFVLALSTSALALWPRPKQLTPGNQALRLSESFDIVVHIDNVPQDLQDAISFTKSALFNDKLERLVVGRGALEAGQIAGAVELPQLELSLKDGGVMRSISEEAVKPIEDREEAYTLDIPSDGSAASLTAISTLGLYRGLTTFQQLWYYYNGTIYSVQTPIKIEDEPAYAYRGLMLDTARNYFPVADIKRTLEAMSLVKLNTFHWHIVDSQSFPLQVPGFLELAAAGAYSATSVYSPEDVQDIVSYAAAHGIDVIAEIDTPGHSSVISFAHPEHIACARRSPWATYAGEPPAGQLRLASRNTTNFTASLIDASSSMFQSKYFSTGGDEINKPCYEDDDETQQALNASGRTLEQALSDFVGATHAVLHDQNKTAIVWEEIVLEHNVTLKNDTVIMVWISSDHVQAIVERGLRVVHAATDYFYLDCGAGSWLGDTPDGVNSCDPFKSWQKTYTFNPTTNLTADQSSLILGGQHLLWTEQSGPENLDSIVWPRAASSAELFWSGPGGNVSEALPRLHDVGFRLRQRGVKAIALQPFYCALRPGLCDSTA